MFKKLSITALLLGLAMDASAQSITIDGLWHQFDVDSLVATSGGLKWIDLDSNALGFDFTLSAPAILTVVDGGFSGDRYQIYDFGALLGETSTTINSYPSSAGINFDSALADTNFSRGNFFLAAGQHQITGLLSLSALDDNQNALNASVGGISLTSVPLPATVWLYSSGCAVMALLSRRRSKQI
jgi:hypothetical protein